MIRTAASDLYNLLRRRPSALCLTSSRYRDPVSAGGASTRQILREYPTVPTDAWITLGVILAVLALLVRGRVSPAVTVFGGAVAVLVLGVIDAEAAFSGFSNSAPITVAALYVLAAGIEKTGALTPVMQSTLGERGWYRLPLLRTLVPTAGASAFLNNTPIVAMLIPHVRISCPEKIVLGSRRRFEATFARGRPPAARTVVRREAQSLHGWRHDERTRSGVHGALDEHVTVSLKLDEALESIV